MTVFAILLSLHSAWTNGIGDVSAVGIRPWTVWPGMTREQVIRANGSSTGIDYSSKRSWFEDIYRGSRMGARVRYSSFDQPNALKVVERVTWFSRMTKPE